MHLVLVIGENHKQVIRGVKSDAEGGKAWTAETR